MSFESFGSHDPSLPLYTADCMSPKTITKDTVPCDPVPSAHDSFSDHDHNTHPPSKPRTLFHPSEYQHNRPRSNTQYDAVATGISDYDTLRDAGVDLELLPLKFLESYPHPALVLVSSVPSELNPSRYSTPSIPHTPYTRHREGGEPSFPADLPWTPLPLFGLVRPLNPIWANSVWNAVTSEPTSGLEGDKDVSNTLLESLSLKSLRRLGHWLSGCEDPSVMEQISKLMPRMRKFRGLDTLMGPNPEPEPLDEPTEPPADNVSASSIILDFEFPNLPSGARLELTKTAMPIYQIVDGSHRCITTHTFVIITTTPRDPGSPSAIGHLGVPRVNGNRPKAERTRDQLLSSQHPNLTKPPGTIPPAPLCPPRADTHMNFESVEALLKAEKWSPDKPIFIHSDGSVSRQTNTPDTWTADGRLPFSVDKLIATTDWSKTPLGDRIQWSPTLEVLIQFLKMYPLCGSVWWGKEFTLIYNQMYGDNLPHHPYAYGLSGREAWGELWSTLGPMTEVVLGGTPIFKEDALILLKGDDNVTTYETYQAQMWITIDEPDGSFGGVFHGMRYTTKRVIGERRAALIRDISERTGATRTLEEFYRSFMECLELAPRDAPFAMLYTVNESSTPTPPSFRRPGMIRPPPRVSTRTVRLKRVGTVGVPDGHDSAPASVNLFVPGHDAAEAAVSEAFPQPLHTTLSTPSTSMRLSLSSQGGASPATTPSGISHSVSSSSTSASPISKLFSLPTLSTAPAGVDELEWPIVEAIHSREPVVVSDCSSLIKGYPIRAWDEPPTSAVVIPIFLKHNQDTPLLILILGLSCRLGFDSDYELFINQYVNALVTQMLTFSLRSSVLENFTSVRSYQADMLRVEESEALDRAKNMLFTNVARQLFTPLNLISGPLDDVLIDMKPGQERDALLLARRHVRRLSRLVNILMDVSRLEANRLKASFRCVNLGKITRDIAGLFSKTAQAANLEFRLKCDVTPHDVYLDREMWEKMLFNLVGNACDYTKQGSITVSVSYTDTQAVFLVKDSGIGIPAVELEHMFSEGTGMALSFTRKLAEIHHGTLEIESHTAEESSDGSHGTTCIVRIPLGTAHLPPDVIDQSLYDPESLTRTGGMAAEDIRRWHSEWSGGIIYDSGFSPNSTIPRTSHGDSPAGSERSTRYDGRLSVGSGGDYLSKGTRINTHYGSLGHRARGIDPNTLFFDHEDVVMIVDNNMDTLRYIRSIFTPFCTVVDARDGQEALDKFHKVNPDIIIADAKLPRLDGLEFLSALREGDRNQQMVPFIILQALQEAQGRCAHNADDYISKPFNARELIARVHMQLQLGKRRKTLEGMFEKRTAELRTINDLSPIGVFRGSTEGYVTYANDRWHDLVGYPKDQRPITDWGHYVAEEDRQQVRTNWEAFHRGGIDRIDDVSRWTNGRWLAATVVRLDPTANGTDGCVGYLVDITPIKLNEELQRQRIVDAEARQAEAEAAKQQQELLIDITSHEIRNPISSLMQISHCASLVKTNLSVLHEQLKRSLESDLSFLPTEQQLLTIDEDLEALDSIYQCGLTQERISNDVLSLGKIQLDMLQMFDVETDLYQEAQKVISVFQNEARMKGISLSFHGSPAFKQLGLSGVMTDPLRLGQIITNLLANAIRFTASSPIRDVELHLDVGTEAPPASSCAKPLPAPLDRLQKDTPIYVFVAVKDTGPGLTPAELDILFQRFSQASPKTHTVFGGSGLGLFVCRKIAEVMGGRIEVVSEAGRGSTFRFFVRALPVLSAENPSAGDGEKHAAKNGPSTKARVPVRKPSTTPHPRRRVLIVEDNLINQKVLTRQLKHIGLDVDVASDGREGLDKIRLAMATQPPLGLNVIGADICTPPPSAKVRPFDCVLMDLEMPVLDGYTATRCARDDEKAGTIEPTVIIALTGNARQALIDEAMADFDDVVVKPYRLDHLLKKMEDAIRKRQANAVFGASP